MCDRCISIENQLWSFQRLRAGVEDGFALALVAEVVKDLEAERASLHPAGAGPEMAPNPLGNHLPDD